MEVGRLAPQEVQNQLQALWQRQPELMRFMREPTENISEGASELTFYLFFVVVRMFQKPYGSQVQEVTTDGVMESFEANQELLEHLARVQDKFLEKLADPLQWDQPHVLRYVVEAMLEASVAEEEALEFSEQEFGYLFLLLKTVVDSLHRASGGGLG